MEKSVLIFLFLVLAGCSNPLPKKQSLLAKEMGAFLISGKYDVELTDAYDSLKIKTGQITLTNDLGLVQFKGYGMFTDLDSISISLNDSIFLRQFGMNRFIGIFPIPREKSGVDEEYFGYAFGEDNPGFAANPEFRQFFNKTNISGSQALFIVGRLKNKDIVIRTIERIVSSGEILRNVNKIFILKNNLLTQR